MNITFNNNKLWDVILIQSNDFYKDKIEKELSVYCMQNKIDKDNTDFNICSVLNTSLEVRDYIIVTFTFETKKVK